MKNLLLVSLLLLFFSCKKKEQSPTNNNNNCLSLIKPVEEAKLYPYNILFEWSGCNDSAYHLMISYDSTFSDTNWVMVDTVITGTSFLYAKRVESNDTIYWKVTTGAYSNSSYFISQNYDDLLAGTYYANVLHKKNYPPYIDTSYTDSITIAKVSEGVLDLVFPHVTRRVTLIPHTPSHHTDFAYYFQCCIEGMLYFYFDTDSVFAIDDAGTENHVEYYRYSFKRP